MTLSSQRLLQPLRLLRRSDGSLEVKPTVSGTVLRRIRPIRDGRITRQGRMKIRIAALMAVAALGMAAPGAEAGSSSAEADAPWVMTDLGVGSAFAVNNHEQVVGVSGVNGHGFVWADGVMTDIGTLGGQRSDPVTINEHGQVIGRARDDGTRRGPRLPVGERRHDRPRNSGGVRLAPQLTSTSMARSWGPAPRPVEIRTRSSGVTA